MKLPRAVAKVLLIVVAVSRSMSLYDVSWFVNVHEVARAHPMLS